MSATDRANPFGRSPASTAVLVAIAAAMATLLLSAAVAGRNARIASETAERHEIAQEDSKLCAELGFENQDERYLRCVGGLGEIRRKQKARWDATIY